MSHPPITNVAKPEDVKTKDQWDQAGRDVVGKRTHLIKGLPSWHINHTTIRVKRHHDKETA